MSRGQEFVTPGVLYDGRMAEAVLLRHLNAVGALTSNSPNSSVYIAATAVLKRGNGDIDCHEGTWRDERGGWGMREGLGGCERGLGGCEREWGDVRGGWGMRGGLGGCESGWGDVRGGLG